MVSYVPSCLVSDFESVHADLDLHSNVTTSIVHLHLRFPFDETALLNSLSSIFRSVSTYVHPYRIRFFVMITRLFGRSHRQRDRDKQEYYRLKYERERRNVVPVKPPLKPTERKVVDPKRQVYDHPYYANPQYAVGGEQQWQQQGNRQQNDQQHEPKRQMRVKFADDVKKHDGGNVCKRSKDRKDADTMQKEGQGKGKGKGKETVQSKTDEGSSKTSEELKKGMKGPW